MRRIFRLICFASLLDHPLMSCKKARSPVTNKRGSLIRAIPNAIDKVPSIPDAPLKLKHLLENNSFPENVSQSLIGLLAEIIIGLFLGQISGTKFAIDNSVIFSLDNIFFLICFFILLPLSINSFVIGIKVLFDILLIPLLSIAVLQIYLNRIDTL